MERIKNFKATIEVNSGLKPKNGNTFPIMEAHDIVVDESGRRLDDKLFEDDSDSTTAFTIDEENKTLVLKAGAGVGYSFEREVYDRNYADAFFSEEISGIILGANGTDITEYHSGGTLSIGGTIDLNGITFEK